MPIKSVADFRGSDDEGGGPGDGAVDGEKLPPYGPGGIYHEKQVGQLCAVHCLNNLLQDAIFDEVRLAEVARGLDAQERALTGGAGLDGSNVRADGFFNDQVIRAALQSIGFEMQRVTAKSSLGDPSKQRGFICNRKEHWFALRRLGREWFDLNSCLRLPRHFTDAELSSQVSEAIAEGYAVFSVRGTFATTDLERNPDRLLKAVQGCGRSRQTHCLFSGEGHTLSGRERSRSPRGGLAGVDPELAAAAESDPDLAAALRASLADAAAPAASSPAAATAAGTSTAPVADSMEDLRRKRLARFSSGSQG